MMYQPKISDRLYMKLKTEQMLEEEMDFKCKGSIAEGKFGEVLLLEMPSGEQKAGKIVKTKIREFQVWPCLEHKNIVQLEKNIFMPDLRAHCFIMPLQYMTLESVMNSGWFQNDDNNIFDIKRWLLDILTGLEYLHGNNICHLNIDLTNILVSFNSVAKLSSFGLTTVSTHPITWSGHKFPYHPPELCYSRGENVLVDPIGVDMWSIGMMMLRLFTKNVIHEELGNIIKPWSKEVYKTIFRVKKFLKLYIYEAYPDLELSPLDYKRLKNFILMFLCLQPEKRPSAEMAKKHRFLSSGLYMPKRDAVWKNKASSVVIEMIVEQHNTTEIVRKRCEERKTTDGMVNSLKPHHTFQLIELSSSSKGMKNLRSNTEKNTSQLNKQGEMSETCRSDVVQDSFLMDNVKVKCDSPLRNKRVHFEEDKELVESHPSKNCQNTQEISKAVHSEKKILSAWDTLRMETPSEEKDIITSDNTQESTSLLNDTVIQMSPDVLDREKPGGGDKEKKSGWLSKTKSWIVQKFRLFRKT